MSEKRFSVRLRSECDGVVYSFFDGDNPLDLDNIIDLLNDQSERIKSLEMELDLIANTKLFSRRKLEEENEQLRQQHQRVYNYFRDYLEEEMSAENFGEMWDNVKEDERWNDE